MPQHKRNEQIRHFYPEIVANNENQLQINQFLNVMIYFGIFRQHCIKKYIFNMIKNHILVRIKLNKDNLILDCLIFKFSVLKDMTKHVLYFSIGYNFPYLIKTLF